jgi:hypothetical protein
MKQVLRNLSFAPLGIFNQICAPHQNFENFKFLKKPKEVNLYTIENKIKEI